MRYFEFKPTLLEFVQSADGPLADLNYLLHHAPVTDTSIVKALTTLKKTVNSTTSTGGLVQPAQTTQQPTQQLAQPTQQPLPVDDTQIEPEFDDEEAPDEIATEDARPARKQKISHRDELLQYAEQATPDQLMQIVYYIKLDTFKHMASDVVKHKIFVKANAIREQIHLAIGALAGKVPVDIMTDFLNDCLHGGVIDCPAMINSQGEGGAIPVPLSREEYRPIVQRLMETTLGSASASGKGEFALAFAGIDTTKGEHDITISGQDIEVKASHRSSDFFFKGQTGFETTYTKKALNKLVKALNSVGGRFKNVNQVGQGGIAQINEKTLKVLQPYFTKMGQDAVIQTLKDVASAIFADSRAEVSDLIDDIAVAVDEQGDVNYDILTLAMSRVAFSYYQQLENHTGILMLNISNVTYSYQTSPDEFAPLIANKVIKATSAIDFRTSTKGCLTFKLT